MKSILILYDHRSDKCITGGQFYEENMYNVMKENSSIEVNRVNINRGRTFIAKLLSPILNLKFFNLCKKYDLVIFNSVEGWYFIPLVISLRLLSNTKLSIIHHHFLYLELKGGKRLFYKILESTFLKLSNFIITVSPYIKSLCETKFKGKNIRIWPIPFSNKIFTDTQHRKSGSLIYIGTIEPRKGLIYLIQALTILKKDNINFNLNIIGKVKDSLYHRELQKIIETHELNVQFHGFVDDKKKDLLLRGAQVFVFPSLLEGYGMVIREVMAYGLPIVCFNNSAMPFLVKNNVNGILVENMNKKEMAKAIELILKNNDLQKKLSKGAIESTKDTITPEKYKDLIYSDLNLIIPVETPVSN